MKIMFLLLLSSVTFALDLGQCVARVESKRYIQNDFSASLPKKIIFSCEYECGLPSGLVIVRGVSTVVVASLFAEAKNVVCQGVRVRQVSWGYDFDGVSRFFIYNNKIPQLKELAYSSGVLVDLASSVHLMEKLKINLAQVGEAYLVAGLSGHETAPVFEAAGRELLTIESELPEITTRIDNYIDQLEKSSGVISDALTAQSLVLRNLKSFANWRIRK